MIHSPFSTVSSSFLFAEGERETTMEDRGNKRAREHIALLILGGGEVSIKRKEIWVRKLNDLKIPDFNLVDEVNQFFPSSSSSSSSLLPSCLYSSKIMVATPDLTITNVYDWTQVASMEAVVHRLQDIEVVTPDWIFEIFKTKSLPSDNHPYRITSIYEDLSKKKNDDNSAFEGEYSPVTKLSMTPSSSSQPSSSSTIAIDCLLICKCGEPKKKWTVKKEGKNKGREFYTCPKDVSSKCQGSGVFQWADEVMTQHATNLSPDELSSSNSSSFTEYGHLSTIPPGI